jgi:hypothetical protein
VKEEVQHETGKDEHKALYEMSCRAARHLSLASNDYRWNNRKCCTQRPDAT